MNIPEPRKLSKAQRTAQSLYEEFGLARTVKRCAKECALARRDRSRYRFEFWTEVWGLVESGWKGGEPSDAESTAALIAELAPVFASIARNANMPGLAHLWNLVRANARTGTPP